jgi:methylated-DNA-[protein]-cysteine S-methyltransferase
MHNKLLSKYYYISMETPAGAFYIVSDQNKIIATAFQKNWKELEKRLGVITNKEIKLLAEAKKQVNEYFKGQRKKFSLPYNMEGTAFQLKAWNALKKIPFGQTISYKAQATLINNPAACRAVGHANSLNPICLFIPLP